MQDSMNAHTHSGASPHLIMKNPPHAASKTSWGRTTMI